MSLEIRFNVFLSHGGKDKTVVRPLTQRLSQHGLEVWFDERVLMADDSICSQLQDNKAAKGRR